MYLKYARHVHKLFFFFGHVCTKAAVIHILTIVPVHARPSNSDFSEQVIEEKLELSPFVLPADMQTVEGMMESGRCVIENTAYQSPEFRKIHMELATFFNAAGQVCLLSPA